MSRQHSVRIRPAILSTDAVDKFIRKQTSANAELRCVCEAGPTGFGLVRHLRSNGIDCIVVAPGKIPKKDGDRIKEALQKSVYESITKKELIMAKRGNKGIRRLIKATGYSWQGLRAAFKYEEAFRLEVCLAVIIMPLGLLVGETATERVLLCGGILLLLIVELLNSALESVVDRVGPEHHEMSGRAKDMGSAAVLVTVVLNGLIWILIVCF